MKLRRTFSWLWLIKTVLFNHFAARKLDYVILTSIYKNTKAYTDIYNYNDSDYIYKTSNKNRGGTQGFSLRMLTGIKLFL